MSSTKIAVAVVVALLLQLLIASYLRFERFDLGYLDLVLIVTVYASFSRDPLWAMLVGASAGLVQDSFSGGILGTQSFIKTVIAFLAGSLSVHIALDNPLPRLIVMAGASIVSGLIFVGLHALFGIRLVPQPVEDSLVHHLGWQLLANVVGAAFIFRLLDTFMRGQEGRRERRPSHVRS
ncbi:MAG: rod shape-determining protein MreD [Acidobacteria bacterium]|nr:rod shape-determining protein MreD [Acidobacteriota bacterium]